MASVYFGLMSSEIKDQEENEEDPNFSEDPQTASSLLIQFVWHWANHHGHSQIQLHLSHIYWKQS